MKDDKLHYQISVPFRTLSVDDDGVHIWGKNGFQKFQKDMPYSTLAAVIYKAPFALTNGNLEFQMIGQENPKPIKGGTISDNVMFFQKTDNDVALMIKKFVETKISECNNHGDSIAKLSDADEILKFKRLLDSGIITQEEFDAKKKQLLNL